VIQINSRTALLLLVQRLLASRLTSVDIIHRSVQPRHLTTTYTLISISANTRVEDIAETSELHLSEYVCMWKWD
jgi:hypothetical protein